MKPSFAAKRTSVYDAAFLLTSNAYVLYSFNLAPVVVEDALDPSNVNTYA